MTPEDVLHVSSKMFPHLYYNRLQLKYDENGNPTNIGKATQFTRLQKDVFEGIRPEKVPYYLINAPKRSSKTYCVALILALLLIDDHPYIDSEGASGDLYLLSNSSLIKTEYPRIFLESPGYLYPAQNPNNLIVQPRSVDAFVESKNPIEIVSSKGVKHYLEPIKSIQRDVKIAGIQNLTTGRRLELIPYTRSKEFFEGKSPFVTILDELGESNKGMVTTSEHSLTFEKFAKLLERTGSSYNTRNKKFIALFFSETHSKDWLESLVQIARDDTRAKAIGKEAWRIFEGYTYKDNPYFNADSADAALSLAQRLGGNFQKLIERDLLDPLNDTVNRVFPDMPLRLEKGEVDALLKDGAWQGLQFKFYEGIDPGFSDKCAVLFCLLHPVKGVYVVQEYYESRRSVDATVASIRTTELEMFNTSKCERLADPVYICKNSQEGSIISMWKKAGLNIKPARRFSVKTHDSITTLIHQDLLKVYEAGCPNLIKEMRHAKIDLETGKPYDKNNHATDALLYICNHFYYNYYSKTMAKEREEEAERIALDKAVVEKPKDSRTYYDRVFNQYKHAMRVNAPPKEVSKIFKINYNKDKK